MDDKSFISKLNKVFDENGLGSLLDISRCEKFLFLTKRLLEENEKYNLTAITDPDKIILNHYADCAVLAKVLPKGATVADIGCGAGFPTLPIAILRDDVRITAIDSTQKRVEYVKQSAALLGLENVRAITMRAEDGGRDVAFREKFDIATARAVAELRVLSELCLPYVKTGGRFIAMKGKNAEFELSGAKRAIALLGGRGARVETVSLKDGIEELTHPMIIIDKKERTPSGYPRPYAQISKKPL
ncbi:MAG: 16S rRNA (guanine(527)-N(7))-methyltransferase RsmG [Clostridia bacterium]|nr:16S rRNA (guanine(527)-N(7))-methyltransferase RsmG [Clostridia bacterium]